MKDHRFHRLLLAAALVASAAPTVAQAPTAIVQGISQITAAGYAGAIHAMPGRAVVPLVAGDDDATWPNLFAAVGGLGTSSSGRVLAVGHEGVLGNNANNLLDTLQFNVQAIDWLDAQQTNAVAVLGGHGEFVNFSNMTVLKSALVGAGFTVTSTPGVVTAAALAGKGVVIVGNAWNVFQASELAALEAHVAAGGGLYLAGLGWSYPSERDFDEYPMNVLGRSYGIGWTRYGISDPTDNVSGNAVFSRYFPDCDLHGADGAYAFVDAMLGAHQNDLDVHLRTDAQARTDFLTAVAHLTSAIDLLPEEGGVRQLLDVQVRALMLQHPQWLGMARVYDRTLDDALIVARAAFGAAAAAAFDLDANRLALLEPALGILDPAVDADYLTILRDHGFLLLDNRSFGSVQRDIVLDLMRSVPDVPRDLRRMTCRDEWSTVATMRAFPIAGQGVNVFGPATINAMENQFPADVAPRTVPIFATTVGHELAHVVDSHLSRTRPAFAARKAALIAAAGLDDMQFLRSQITAQFFQNNKIEFFASLANEWNTDTVHTLRLALQRFATGKEQPVQQALLMADTYGHDGMTTPIYSMAASGAIGHTTADLSRDVEGRITAICAGSSQFLFAYDTSGNVVTAVETSAPCGSVWSDLGLGLEGSLGMPVAAGGGGLVGGTAMAVHVRHAQPLTLGLLVFGVDRVDVSVFGGILVPSPTVTMLVVTDASGSGVVTLPWPAGLAGGLEAYFQAWLFDAAGAAGFSASNGLLGITP